MRFFQAFFVTLLLGVGLAACTPGDLATLRQVTVEDGAAYIRENHDWRAELREIQRAMVRETVAIKKTQCQALLLQSRFDAALACLRETGRLMEEAYPPLATIEALREGRAVVNELRGLFRDPAPVPE